MADGEDREITLGTGKLLGLFFVVVAVCAVFFGLGYLLGRPAASPAPAATEAVPQAAPTSGAPKPSAAKPGETKADAAAPSTTDELTFYKSVEQKDAAPQLPASG